MAETKRTGIIDKDWGNILANVVESTATPWTYGLVALNPDWSDIGWPASAIVIWNPVVGWNPWRILYIDQAGNLFGDDSAVRDSWVQKQTTIGSLTYAQGNANDWVSAEVYFQADNIGDTGNSISLVFDGVDDADTVLNAWNTANPWNTASIVDWLGTTVPTAGTRPFIGWWEIIYESGTVNNGISTNLQGSGAWLQDITNSKFCFSDTGNLTTIIWEPSLWFIAAGIDWNTGNLWAMVVSDSGINFFVTDQSTYNARLQGDDVEIILAYNGTYLWVNGLSWPLWWDSSSNRYILPTNVTPSVGDTLAVAGISGNDYALDFVAWWVTIGNAVWGGSPNEILFADWSTKVAQSSDLFFDATQKIFRVWDVSSTANDTVLTINDTTKTIRADYWTGRYFLMQNNGIWLDNMSFSWGASVWWFILSNDDNNVTFQNGATFTIGMALDYANNVYSIWNTNAGTPTKVTIDGTNQDVSIIANKTIKATNIFWNKFILADMLNKLYKIWDIDATNNSTIITVDDAAKTIKSSGGIIKNYTAQTTTYNILRNDYTINCTSGTFTVTLPTAVGFAGQTYVIKNSGAWVITLATTSSQTIDGVTTQTLAASLSLTVTSTWANWIII